MGYSSRDVKVMRRNVLVVAFVAMSMLQPTAGRAQKQGYGVSVGLLTVSKATGWDFLSTTDFQVQIRRRDPAIEARISALSVRVDKLDQEADRLSARIKALERKKAASEIEPQPPVTKAQRERLAELSELTLAEAAESDVREFRRLKDKIEAREEASKRKPRPPLAAAEKAELHSLSARRDDVRRELSGYERRRSDARALIYGHTRTIDSDSRILDFNSGPVLTVYEGDSLLITVVDSDFGKDDLIGNHSLAVTSQILETGGVELGHSGHVRALQLGFTPTSP